MEKNIKVEEDLWKKLQQEKIFKGYKKISDLIRDKINFIEKFSSHEPNPKGIGLALDERQRKP